MRRTLSLALCLVIVASLSGLAWAGASTTTVGRDYSGYNFADSRNAGVLHGDGLGLSKAAGDTFFLYGGPAPEPGQPGYNGQGKFQTATLQPDRQGWTGVDLTEVLPNWNVSDFNAGNLSTAAPGYWTGAFTVPATNHAMWDGVPAGTSGFTTAPGYGNNWADQLDRRWTVTSTAVSTSLTWNFVFNHDSEPGYDFLVVQWDSAGSMLDLASFDADNRDTGGTFTTPALFSTALTVLPGQYAGPSSNQVHLRLLFDSDGAWSDEDGLWPTDGACQVDNIQVSGNNGVGLSQATFESGANGGWAPVPADFCGDFSKVFPRVEEIDPCRENETPQMTFIDDGTPPANDPLLRTTGGSTSPTWSYGVPGGWVVNYTGGLTLGSAPLNNEVWSPVIAWNLAGTADDAIDGGAFIRRSVWQHQPLANGIFHVWHVRSSADGGTTWTGWGDRNFVYYSPLGLYLQNDTQVRDLIVGTPTHVQMAMGCTDLAEVFAFPGNDATPGPLFDYLAFAKYLAVGPGLTTRTIDIFQDGFAESGASGCAAPDGDYAVRVDMARDIRAVAVPAAVPGDSLIMDVVARKPGAVVDTTSIFMGFVLQTQNPDHFATARSAALTALGATQIAPDKWRGQVAGQRSRTSAGAVVNNRWYFDLPDGATTNATYQSAELPLFFPGDQIRYYITAGTTTPTEFSTSPGDTSGLVSGVGYSRVWTISALPTLTWTGPTTCSHPGVLVWNDLEHRGGENELLQAFNQNGLTERVSFDTYTTKGPTSLVSNGLGGIHGANAAQLSGYSCLFYESGDLNSCLISDGSNANNNDKGNDVGVLTAWMGQAADRFAAYWGDSIAFGMTSGGATYRSTIMNVALVSNDVRASIGNQTAPRVSPTAAGTPLGFNTDYIAYGGCLGINQFDDMGPGTGAVKAHEFLNAAGTGGVYTPSASVYYATQDTIAAQAYDRVNVSFPYGLCYVQDVTGGPNQGGNRSARANLVRELLISFGHSALLDVNVVAADPIANRLLAVAQNRPNPFNPSTEIAFTAPARGKVTVSIYNLRGELVTTLLNDVVEAGQRSVIWNGVDGRGRSVASGIYLYQVDGFGQSITKKMALVK
jgi:hypothetical protein